MKERKILKLIAFLIFIIFMAIEISIVENEGTTVDYFKSSLAIESSSGDLTCADLSNCDGLAGCNESGTVTGCTLNCKSGGSVNCPYPDPGEG